MDTSMGAIWEKPAGWKEMERLQKIIRDLTAPYDVLRQPAFLNIVSAFEVSYQREAKRLTEICTPEVLKILQTEIDILKNFSSMQDTWMVTASQIAKWSETIFDRDAFGVDAPQSNIVSALERMSVIAARIEEVDTGEFVESGDSAVLSIPLEEQGELASEIDNILADDKNWEQRLMDRIEVFKRTHPLWARLLKFLFFYIFLEIFNNVCSTELGQMLFPAKVYEEPNTQAPIIYHIEQHQQVVIIGEVPYYYEIETNDIETNEIKTGYVSKRSVELKEIDAVENIDVPK